MLRSVKHSLLPLSVASRPQLVLPVCLHTSPVSSSRIKKVQRHKPLWHIKKLNKAEDAPVTLENRDFIKEVISDQYSGDQAKISVQIEVEVPFSGPLKSELAPWARGTWEPWTRRCGVLGVKIGVQPLWLRNGKMILTTMLHVTDNHVVKFTPRAEYDKTYLAEKELRPCFTGPSRKKGENIYGMILVGSHSTDPQKYTKDYCGLFTDSGLMPKRYLARFPVTENATIQPGTSLTASHFSVGQWVDVLGELRSAASMES